MIFEPFRTGNVFKMRHGNVWATIVMDEQLFYEAEHSAIGQLRNTMELPGVEGVTALPGMHYGYGVPIEVTLSSSTHLFPDTVGVDPSCSVGISKVNLDLSEFSKPQKRELLSKLEQEIGVGNQLMDTGMTMVSFKKIIEGSMRPDRAWINSSEPLWKQRQSSTYKKLISLIESKMTANMLKQINTIGGGNHHFSIDQNEKGETMIISHFGSRGLGAELAKWFDYAIKNEIEKWGGSAPNNLLYVPAESDLGQLYYYFNIAMAEYATYNHFSCHRTAAKVMGVELQDFGHVPHNFIEFKDGKYVGRKGTIPAYDNQGIPLVVLGNMTHGNAVFSPGENSHKYGESISHGAGRVHSRSQAKKLLDQKKMDSEFEEAGVIGNFRNVPIDEAHDAYKDFDRIVSTLVDTGAGVLEYRTKPIMVLKGA